VFYNGIKWDKVANKQKRIMLIGEYTHTIDEKNRISLPARFRKELGKKVVVTHGLDTCLFIYSLTEWSTISTKLASLGMGQADTRGFVRFMLAGAVEVEVDGSGRILIPDFLKSFAGLSEKVVFTGVHTRLELWNEQTWTEYKRQIERDANQMAEKLGGGGFF
jgi:MraZ protein